MPHRQVRHFCMQPSRPSTNYERVLPIPQIFYIFVGKETLFTHLMEVLRLITYVSPVTEVIEVMLEGIVCASGEVPNMERGWDLDF